jgi:hypothetical protein
MDDFDHIEKLLREFGYDDGQVPDGLDAEELDDWED